MDAARGIFRSIDNDICRLNMVAHTLLYSHKI